MLPNRHNALDSGNPPSWKHVDAMRVVRTKHHTCSSYCHLQNAGARYELYGCTFAYVSIKEPQEIIQIELYNIFFFFKSKENIYLLWKIACIPDCNRNSLRTLDRSGIPGYIVSWIHFSECTELWKTELTSPTHSHLGVLCLFWAVTRILWARNGNSGLWVIVS